MECLETHDFTVCVLNIHLFCLLQNVEYVIVNFVFVCARNNHQITNETLSVCYLVSSEEISFHIFHSGSFQVFCTSFQRWWPCVSLSQGPLGHQEGVPMKQTDDQFLTLLCFIQMDGKFLTEKTCFLQTGDKFLINGWYVSYKKITCFLQKDGSFRTIGLLVSYKQMAGFLQMGYLFLAYR